MHVTSRGLLCWNELLPLNRFSSQHGDCFIVLKTTTESHATHWYDLHITVPRCQSVVWAGTVSVEQVVIMGYLLLDTEKQQKILFNKIKYTVYLIYIIYKIFKSLFKMN